MIITSVKTVSYSNFRYGLVEQNLLSHPEGTAPRNRFGPPLISVIQASRPILMDQDSGRPGSVRKIEFSILTHVRTPELPSAQHHTI